MVIVKGKIFFVIGPTASGKTSIVNYILNHRKNTLRAVSYTTREKRNDEINGKDYFFVAKEEFLKLIKKRKFIEHSKVYGNYYGTSKYSFSKINEGFDVIKIIDYKGAKKFKKSKINIVYLFFTPKDIKILEERLKNRGDKDIKERLKQYKKEIEFKKECDYYIDTSGNKDLEIENCAKKVIGIMNRL